MPPTYGMYQVAAEINNVNIFEVPLKNNFQINDDLVLSTINKNIKIIFICSPNNPSGNILDQNSVKSILSSFNGLVVIDEAYIDFADTKSWINELKYYNNLIVLQTFSKAWGLASIRVGMAYACKEIIDVFNSIKYPYNVNGISQQIVLNTLDHELDKNLLVKKIIIEREKLAKNLESLDFIEYVYPSNSNFLLVKVADADNIYNYLLSNKIIVRNRSKLLHCHNCLRFTVGTEIENQRLIEVLNEYGV